MSLTHSPLGALALRVEVRVSEAVDAEAEHVVGLQGFTKEVAVATAILPQTEKESIHASIWKKLGDTAGNKPTCTANAHV